MAKSEYADNFTNLTNIFCKYCPLVISIIIKHVSLSWIVLNIGNTPTPQVMHNNTYISIINRYLLNHQHLESCESCGFRKCDYRVLVRVSLCMCLCLCVCFCTITKKEIDLGT